MNIDPVGMYFSAVAGVPLRTVILYSGLSAGVCVPHVLGGSFEVSILGMWPLHLFVSAITWGMLSFVAIFMVLCLFGCLYKFMVGDVTVQPLFIGFSICYLISIREAAELLWLAVALYVLLLAAYIWLPVFRDMREREVDGM